MPVEFLGIAATNDGSEITARSGASFDKDNTLRLARAHEENGWDRALFAYGSGAPDPGAMVLRPRGWPLRAASRCGLPGEASSGGPGVRWSKPSTTS